MHPSIVASDAAPTEADRVISADASAEMRAMLRQVVVRGTAKAADVPGYEVGGKTGTADKPNASGGYARDKTISTFAAFFPAGDPKYVLVIALDEPTAMINNTAFRTAGLTAAPVVGKAVRRLAPVLGMRPELPARGRARRCFTRWPETNSPMPEQRPTRASMAGTERTDKLTGFEALGLLTGTRRGRRLVGPAARDHRPLGRQPRAPSPATCSRRCPAAATHGAELHPLRARGWAPPRC